MREKPTYGSPCNGCGACCKAVPCVIAQDLLGAVEGPCPALEQEGGRYWCGLIRSASRHISGLENKPWADDTIRHLLLDTGAWSGECDSLDEPHPDPVPPGRRSPMEHERDA